MASPSGSSADLGLRYPQGNLYGLNLAVATTTTATLSAGFCLDSTYAKNMSLSAPVTINFGVVGLNGIDVGAIEANKLYYVFLVSDSLNGNPTGALVSLSATPVMPIGANGVPYDTIRRVGWLRTAAGGATLLSFTQYGKGVEKTYMYDTMISVLNNGTAQSLTAFDMSVAVPPLDNIEWYSHVEFTPASAGNSVKFTPFGSTATVIQGVIGQVASVKNTGHPKLVAKLDDGVPKTLYINSASACDSDVWCAGFVDAL